jgi:hypothetical protein
MANNRSMGVLFVTSNDPVEINQVLARLVQLIDEAKGLRGRAVIHDRTGVGAPTAAGDAARLSDIPGVTAFIVLGDATVGNEVSSASQLRFVDANGTLIHGIIE